jgi:penicillin-binding protein 2
VQPHAWFVGYTDDAANSGLPDIAIAVILENQGEGSDWAAPVFRGIVQAYYYGSIQTVPWFGPFDNPYTPTPFGGVPTKTPRPRGRQPTPTP